MPSKKKKGVARPAPRPATPKATPVVNAPTSARTAREPVDFSRALLNAWRVNDRITHELLALVAPHIWRAFPQSSKRRNIATSFAHIHNVRCMRIKMSHSTVAVPERLDRAEITPDDARKALAESADAMAALIQLGLDAGGHVPNYHPDVVALVCYAITHEAHHRGQISHWCRELGVPITPEQSLAMWEWDKLHKKVNRE
ncbi:MAG TPA: DinB family protein [Gemmatimonadaceae bacterium]|nr:DinB family protein [Gemmatimonadaceae bacterium]